MFIEQLLATDENNYSEQNLKKNPNHRAQHVLMQFYKIKYFSFPAQQGKGFFVCFLESV